MTGGGTGDRVCLGAFAGAHGVRGVVKIKSFTEDPEAVASYGPLSDEAGTRVFALSLCGTAKGVLLARVDGIDDRDAAQALKGVRLYVDRAALPEPEDDSFYHADLIGLPVFDAEGGPDDGAIGRVTRIGDHGAGDVVEIRREGPDGRGRTLVLPFTRAVFPVVDIRAGRVEVRLPGEVTARAAEGETEDRPA